MGGVPVQEKNAETVIELQDAPSSLLTEINCQAEFGSLQVNPGLCAGD